MIHLKRVVPATLVVAALVGCGADESRDRYFDRGVALYEAGDLVKAKLEFRNVLQIDAKDADAWFLLGRIAEKERNWTEAFRAYSRAVELDPENARARVKRGRLLLAGNQSEEALGEAEILLSANPRDPEALVLRSAVRSRLEQRDLALADVREALTLDPKHREGLVLLGEIRLAQGDAQGAVAAVKQAIDAHPNDTRLLLALGNIYETAGLPHEAADVLRTMVETEPDVLTHRQRLAAYLAEQGHDDQALAVYRDSIAFNPEETEAKLALLQFMAEYHSVEEASQELERMLAVTPDIPKLRFALAELRGNAGDARGAREAYEQVINDAGTAPAGLEARWRLASLAMTEGNSDEAAALASQVLASDPGNEQALLIRCALALERDDIDQVIADARTVLKNNPSSVGAMRLLAQGHLKKDELALAQDVLANAITIAPDQPVAYMELASVRVAAGDLDGALATLDALLQQVPDNLDAQTATAHIQLGQQDWAALEASSKRILESNPEHPLGYYLHGLLLQRQGDLEAAIAAFQAALDRASGAREPLLSMGRAYAAQGRFDQAETSIRQLLAATPNDIAASTLLAQILEAAGRIDQSTEVYEETIRFHPQESAGYLGLASLQQRLGENAAAISTLRKGADATSRNASLLFDLAMLYHQSAQYEDAAAVYEEILATNPRSDVVANNFAMLLLEVPNATQAQLNRALDLARRFESSDRPEFLDTLGWAHYRVGQYDQAAGILNRVLRSGEPFPELQYHLGLTYLKLGRTGDAAELLQSAAMADPPFPWSEDAKAALEAIDRGDKGS